jgi:hypothetical protein
MGGGHAPAARRTLCLSGLRTPQTMPLYTTVWYVNYVRPNLLTYSIFGGALCWNGPSALDILFFSVNLTVFSLGHWSSNISYPSPSEVNSRDEKAGSTEARPVTSLRSAAKSNIFDPIASNEFYRRSAALPQPYRRWCLKCGGASQQAVPQVRCKPAAVTSKVATVDSRQFGQFLYRNILLLV